MFLLCNTYLLIDVDANKQKPVRHIMNLDLFCFCLFLVFFVYKYFVLLFRLFVLFVCFCQECAYLLAFVNTSDSHEMECQY